MKTSTSELEEVKAMVNELTKTMNEVTRKLQDQKGPEPRKCFTCQEIGHISRNCPNKKKQERGELKKGKEPILTVKKMDVRFFEFVDNKECQSIRTTIKKKVLDVKNCLKIEIDTNQETFNVRNLQKHWHVVEEEHLLRRRR
ncbi:4127_t:CDS:1 [Racocetra fulgida]|uniref:4127_t:CDS:1 n=1 Tax=Racocetra fulgida TaxID=60492 RepID=A0A9N8ZCF4_9GLOM|nr:4127_t:CDS:1 [Racocetra fulgida]